MILGTNGLKFGLLWRLNQTNDQNYPLNQVHFIPDETIFNQNIRQKHSILVDDSAPTHQ